MSEHASTEHPVYNYAVVRQFTIMTVVWGIVGPLMRINARTARASGTPED
jgi:cytochrome c oxidase cbb3-type subunit 1